MGWMEGGGGGGVWVGGEICKRFGYSGVWKYTLQDRFWEKEEGVTSFCHFHQIP